MSSDDDYLMQDAEMEALEREFEIQRLEMEIEMEIQHEREMALQARRDKAQQRKAGAMVEAQERRDEDQQKIEDTEAFKKAAADEKKAMGLINNQGNLGEACVLLKSALRVYDRLYPPDQPLIQDPPRTIYEKQSQQSVRESYEAFCRRRDASRKLVQRIEKAGGKKAKPKKPRPEQHERSEMSASGEKEEYDDLRARVIEDLVLDDVIGQDECVDALFNLARQTNMRAGGKSVGGSRPSVLLYGPPGTGKTMVAKALCGSTKRDFVEVSCADLLDKYVGESPKRMRAYFDLAIERGAILFMDEIDKLLNKDSAGVSEQILQVLQVKIGDIFDLADRGKPHPLVIAATNEPEVLSEALMRRFGQKIEVGLPTREARDKLAEKVVLKKEIACLQPWSEHSTWFLDASGGWSADNVVSALVAASSINIPFRATMVKTGGEWVMREPDEGEETRQFKDIGDEPYAKVQPTLDSVRREMAGIKKPTAQCLAKISAFKERI